MLIPLGNSGLHSFLSTDSSRPSVPIHMRTFRCAQSSRCVVWSHSLSPNHRKDLLSFLRLHLTQCLDSRSPHCFQVSFNMPPLPRSPPPSCKAVTNKKNPMHTMCVEPQPRPPTRRKRRPMYQRCLLRSLCLFSFSSFPSPPSPRCPFPVVRLSLFQSVSEARVHNLLSWPAWWALAHLKCEFADRKSPLLLALPSRHLPGRF